VPSRHLTLRGADDAVAEGLRRIRDTEGVPDDFPPAVLEEAEGAAAAPRYPETDRRELPLVTIDPHGSTDLDQAVHVERSGRGFTVWYAVADVGAFVRPGGAIDGEAWRRVETRYAPDRRTPLHPPVLSEGAASLLPDGDRPALLWRISVDADGEGTEASVERAVVRSRAQLAYGAVQRWLDAGSAPEPLALLRELGLLRQRREVANGAVDLPIPEQQVSREEQGWRLRFRAPLPVEGWNAQVSLLTGMAAASLMLAGGIGVLRTLPPADPRDLARLRRVARALGVDWPAALPYPDLVRSLDPANPRHAALLSEATTVLRGAGYAPFTGPPPDQARHAALAQEYTHCTAPLRRLVDRYAGEICLALCAGTAVPEWVTAGLPRLPPAMADGNRRSGRYQRACVDLVEAVLLSGREGDEFDAVVVDLDGDRPQGTVQLREPAVRGRVSGPGLPLGEQVRVRLVTASLEPVHVAFALA
jgi:exoribonuclease R